MTTPISLLITTNLSSSDAALGTQVNTTLVSLGAIAIVDMSHRVVPAGNNRVHQVTLLYYPGGQVYGAAEILARTGQDIDALVTAWAAANPTYRALRFFDTSPDVPRVDLFESVLIVYSTTPDIREPLVVRNATGGAIASGASGTLTALGSAGATARTVTGKNMGDAAWAADKEGYCSFDPVSGTWLCVPHCC